MSSTVVVGNVVTVVVGLGFAVVVGFGFTVVVGFGGGRGRRCDSRHAEALAGGGVGPTVSASSITRTAGSCSWPSSRRAVSDAR